MILLSGKSIDLLQPNVNPFKPSGAKWLHYMQRQSARTSKNKNGGLDQYGFEHFVV